MELRVYRIFWSTICVVCWVDVYINWQLVDLEMFDEWSDIKGFILNSSLCFLRWFFNLNAFKKLCLMPMFNVSLLYIKCHDHDKHASYNLHNTLIRIIVPEGLHKLIQLSSHTEYQPSNLHKSLTTTTTTGQNEHRIIVYQVNAHAWRSDSLAKLATPFIHCHPNSMRGCVSPIAI